MFGRRMDRDPERDRFTRLYQANHRQMFRLAVQILGPGPKAEDAVHDAFVKLIRHFDQLWDKPEDRLSGWLSVVVKNAGYFAERTAGNRAGRRGMGARRSGG